MSKENKTVELKEEDLQEVSGGGGFIPMMHVTTPCGCKKIWVSGNAQLEGGQVLGKCETHGWIGEYVCGTEVHFYIPDTDQSSTGYLSSN